MVCLLRGKGVAASGLGLSARSCVPGKIGEKPLRAAPESTLTCDMAVLFQLGRCRSVKEFEKLNRIGEGTYGIVCKCSTVCSFRA